MPTAPAPRRRDADTTRAAILASARAAFAECGYDGAGVRGIAAGAGVTAMLVNRYFGSKEGLFAEAVAATMAEPVILSAENLREGDLARAMVTALIDMTDGGATPLEGFQIMLRSAGSARAAEIAREQIERHHQKTLSAALSGSFAAERAALALALVAGVQVMRQMIAMPALVDADRETLIDLLTPLLRQLIGGET